MLAVTGLTVSFPKSGIVVAGIDFELAASRTLGVVGESGSGKTMTALALMGLVPPPGIVTGSIKFGGAELLGQPAAGWRALRGRRMAMVFQEPATALNPVMTIGRQIAETLVLHGEASGQQARERAISLLDETGIPAPRERARAYPHQLSGGMRQRAMIAMALACHPELLVADEPTTALDVTIQAQILDLLRELQDEIEMAMIFISHNLAVVSEVAHDIIVMYAGRIVENAETQQLFSNPLHPYTQALIATQPDLAQSTRYLPAIPGSLADLNPSTPGCRFAPRCPRADRQCGAAEPPLLEVAPGHRVACFKAGL